MNKYYGCIIKGCWKQFIFNNYFSLFQCYYSLNGEPEKSSGAPNNVVNFKVQLGSTIPIRHLETFRFYLNSENIFSIDYHKSNFVLGLKQEIENSYNIKILSLYGYKQYYQIPKLMNNFDTFNCTEGNEFKVELSQYLSIINLNNTLNKGITSFKTNETF